MAFAIFHISPPTDYGGKSGVERSCRCMRDWKESFLVISFLGYVQFCLTERQRKLILFAVYAIHQSVRHVYRYSYICNLRKHGLTESTLYYPVLTEKSTNPSIKLT